MKISLIIKKHLSTFEHFLEQDGYPLRIGRDFLPLSEAQDFCKATRGAFAIEGDMLFRDKSHGFDWEIVAEYWKFRCEEEKKELRRIFKIIDEAHRRL